MKLKLVLVSMALTLGATHFTHAAEKPAPDRLSRIVVHGDSLVGNLAGDSPDRKVSVYLPPSYAKETRRRYPVLYLLHGFTDSDARWFGFEGKHFVNAPNAVDEAFKNGVQEMIVVMPNALNRYGGSFYASSVVIGDWETFVTRELVRYMDAHYRTLARPESRGLAGHSMGGYGTLRLAMKAPGIFSVLYVMSPCCVAANLSPDPKMFERAAAIKSPDEIAGEDFMTKAVLAAAAAWAPNPNKPPLYLDLPVVDGKLVPEVLAEGAANSPLSMLPQYIPALKTYRALAIDAGDKDVPIVDTIRALHAKLDEFAIPHTFEVYEGDHTNRIADRLTTKVLPFFGARLKAQGK